MCRGIVPTNPRFNSNDGLDGLEFDVSFIQEDEVSFDEENRPVFRQRRMFNRKGPF